MEYINVLETVFSQVDASMAPVIDKLKLKKPKIPKTLGALFKKKDKKNSIENSKDSKVFGGLLDSHCRLPDGTITLPSIMTKCVDAIESRGMTSQGIYRLSGNSSSIQKLKAAFNHHESVDMSEELDINAISGLLKLVKY
jgi:hypothetical protein